MNSLLITHFNELRRLFLSSQKNIGKKISPKRVHAFRVAIKRLRAFFLLSEFLSKGRFRRKKSDRKLKKIFDKAGKVRTFHVHDLLLKKFNVRTKRGQVLDNDSSLFIKDLKTGLLKFKAKEIFSAFEKNIKKLPAHQDKKKMEKRILKLSHQILRRSIGLGKKRDFHKARIQLKRAHYILEIFRNRQPSAKKIITIIDPVEDKLGLWQDWDEMMGAVKKATAVEKSKEVKAIQQKLTGDLLNERTRLESQLHRDFTRLEKIFSSSEPVKSTVKNPK